MTEERKGENTETRQRDEEPKKLSWAYALIPFYNLRFANYHRNRIEREIVHILMDEDGLNIDAGSAYNIAEGVTRNPFGRKKKSYVNMIEGIKEVLKGKLNKEYLINRDRNGDLKEIYQDLHVNIKEKINEVIQEESADSGMITPHFKVGLKTLKSELESTEFDKLPQDIKDAITEVKNKYNESDESAKSIVIARYVDFTYVERIAGVKIFDEARKAAGSAIEHVKKRYLFVPAAVDIAAGAGILYMIYRQITAGDTTKVDEVAETLNQSTQTVTSSPSPTPGIEETPTPVPIETSEMPKDLEELSRIIGTGVPEDTAINRAFEYGGRKIVAIGSDSIPLHAALDDKNPLLLDKIYDALRMAKETSDVYVVGGENPAIYVVADGKPTWMEHISPDIVDKIFEAYKAAGTTDYEILGSGTLGVN